MHATHGRWALVFAALIVITGGRHMPWPVSAGTLATLGIIALYSAWRPSRRTSSGQGPGDVVWRGQRIPRAHVRRSLTTGQIVDTTLRLAPGAVLLLLALAQLLRGIGW